MAETKQVTPERISRALDRVAGAIVKLKERGHELLPLYERLEKELAAARRTDRMLERVRQRPSRVRSRDKMKKHDFEPGSFGAHEALHTADMLMDLVDARLMQHPTIAERQDWLTLAETAHQALFDLYQAIGAEHFADGNHAERLCRKRAGMMALKNLREITAEEDAAITADAEADPDNPPADKLFSQKDQARGRRAGTVGR